jgi:hypothetical protein
MELPLKTDAYFIFRLPNLYDGIFLHRRRILNMVKKRIERVKYMEK